MDTAAETRRRLRILLPLAVFVVVIDSTIMNVSIGALVDDLDTEIAGVQSAIALYALVMASFLLTGAKLGDILGRRRAFSLGLGLYGVGLGRNGAQSEPDDADPLLVGHRGTGSRGARSRRCRPWCAPTSRAATG